MSAMNSRDKSIMFITDGDSKAEAMKAAFVRENYAVTCKSGIRTCINRLPEIETDLLLVETNNLSLDELAVFAEIRLLYSGLFVIIAETINDTMQIMLYEHGIDDILLKSVNRLLLIARIRVLFRRGFQQKQARLTFNGGLEINSSFRQVKYRGEEIHLTSKEFDLLWFMAQHYGTTLDREQLYQAVFGIEYNGYDRSIDMYISRLRNKMGTQHNSQQVIKTVRGKGYLFAAR